MLNDFIEFEGRTKVGYMGTMEALGQTTGWQASWFIQTDQGSVVWEGDVLQVEASRDDQPEFAELIGFPGFDRAGVLRGLMKAVQGEPSAVPTVADNLKSMAFIHAAELSVREGREVRLAELL